MNPRPPFALEQAALALFLLGAAAPPAIAGTVQITPLGSQVVRGHYGAKLAAMNIGDRCTTGPKEAAYVVDRLITPSAVIASHVGEAATMDGKVLPNTETEPFIKASSVPVHLPSSGRTMGCDSDGNCVRGC